MSTRIERRFSALKDAGRAALVTFVTAGDPDRATADAILAGLPAAGADLIELGMPFSDPMADGPAIQAASLRALAAGASLRSTLDQVRRFRQADDATPVILMGYFNPIHSYGPAAFVADARAAGVDGLIVVDLPPEEDPELCLPARAAGLDFIRLATPTTDAARLPTVLHNSSGFLYYVSMTGITGVGAPDLAAVAGRVAGLRDKAGLPVAVGFGIRGAEQAKAVAAFADAVVVGSALVEQVARAAGDQAAAVAGVLTLVRELAGGIRAARPEAAAG